MTDGNLNSSQFVQDRFAPPRASIMYRKGVAFLGLPERPGRQPVRHMFEYKKALQNEEAHAKCALPCIANLLTAVLASSPRDLNLER
jgi:hypothetical protein